MVNTFLFLGKKARKAKGRVGASQLLTYLSNKQEDTVKLKQRKLDMEERKLELEEKRLNLKERNGIICSRNNSIKSFAGILPY